MVAVTLGLAGALLGCQATPAADRAGGAPVPTTLTLLTGEGDPSEVQPFVNAVRRLTNGSLTINVKTGWRTGEADYESGIIRDVIDGKADLVVTGVRAFDAESLGVTAFRGFLAPFLITTYDLQERVPPGRLPGRRWPRSSRSACRHRLIPAAPAALGISRRLAGVATRGRIVPERARAASRATLDAAGRTTFVPDDPSG
jgi:hypothetical protein